jgi:hypothetical protein
MHGAEQTQAPPAAPAWEELTRLESRLAALRIRARRAGRASHGALVTDGAGRCLALRLCGSCAAQPADVLGRQLLRRLEG